MLFLIRAVARLSLCNLQRLGFVLGWLGYAFSRTYRQRLVDHATQAGLTLAQRREAVASAGRMVAELPRLWLRPRDEPLGALVQWQGDALLDKAIRDGRGVVLLTPHLGCFEIAAQAIAEHFGQRITLTVMYRPAKQAWLSELQRTTRDRPGLVAVPAATSGVRQMIRALRRGQAVGLLPDQVPPLGQGVWAPFFGRPAYTMTLAARLVQQTGATLLSIWVERLAAGRGYVVRVAELAEPLSLPGLDDAALQAHSAGVVNREMERLIGQRPGQYLWAYHRYKAPREPGAERAEGSGRMGDGAAS